MVWANAAYERKEKEERQSAKNNMPDKIKVKTKARQAKETMEQHCRRKFAGRRDYLERSKKNSNKQK